MMKTKTMVLKACAFALMVGTVLQFAACSKNKDINPSNEEILNKKIEDIIPQKYIDSLTRLGFVINRGTNPPNVEGAYSFKPFVLKASNIPGDVSPGYTFSSGVAKFYEQSNQDFGIKMLGKNFISTNDTSVVTAISGDANKFTIYGKVKSSKGSYYSYVAFLMSGEKEGNTIKNAVAGILNIDNTHGSPDVIKEGYGRVAYDGDQVSEQVEFSKMANAKESNNKISLKELKNLSSQ